MEVNKEKLVDYWNQYCLETNQHNDLNRLPDAWPFGDNPNLADNLLSYVLSGEKTTTTGLLLEHEIEKYPIPTVGGKSIILDGNGNPACIIETISVQIKKFNEVDEEFALKEGEGFTSLEDWRMAHWTYFTRRCKVLNIELHEEIEVICEEFKVIYK